MFALSLVNTATGEQRQGSNIAVKARKQVVDNMDWIHLASNTSSYEVMHLPCSTFRSSCHVKIREF
jgi:hypothetical protein